MAAGAASKWVEDTANDRPTRLTRAGLWAAAAALADRDPHLAVIHQNHGPPPMWARRPGFPTLLRIILEQQVSLISARAMFARLKSNIEPFTAEAFIEAGEGYLRSLGVTRQKAHYCVQVAHAFTDGRFNNLGRMNDDDAHATLLDIKGVGPWTANIYLLMALRRPDVWPDGDVALATAVTKLRKMNARPSFPQLAQLAERWRPYRSVAARMLWQYYLAEREAKRQLNDVSMGSRKGRSQFGGSTPYRLMKPRRSSTIRSTSTSTIPTIPKTSIAIL